MTQKILATHADGASSGAELVRVKVDQVVLAREANRVLGHVSSGGLRKIAVEVAVAYSRFCISSPAGVPASALASGDPWADAPIPLEALDLGLQVARPGIGFAPMVHLERFGSPARLVLTDEPRLAAIGGAGALAMPASTTQLLEALRTGFARVRAPRAIQILLTGRLRPFVCLRDVALELSRRGLADMVQRVDALHDAPVVLEFGGPGARFLSVADRAVLCAMAPQLGAAAALFLSDEKTELYLRDQRRSKAHRSLSPDAGAPCDEVVTIDLGAVDPLLMDEAGKVRQVRELAGRRVGQVLLGGDSGITLRDLLATAALLKSKRVPSHVEFLLAPPSRQALEVLARTEALVDLITAGARIVEPDQRILSGELYAPPRDDAALRTCDPEPGNGAIGLVASAETLAYAVASGEIGDPRAFKRPARLTLPRNLPTDDVLLVRKPRSKAASKKKPEGSPSFAIGAPRKPSRWQAEIHLSVSTQRLLPLEPSALLARTLADVQWAAHEARRRDNLRAIIAPHIPAATVCILNGLGVLALRADRVALDTLGTQRSLTIPAPSRWSDGEIQILAGPHPVRVTWLARGDEREWIANPVDSTVPA